MDIPRHSKKGLRRFRTIIFLALGLSAVLLTTFGATRLKRAAPTVDRAAVWIDTVKRGPMLRQVRGAGTLVPQEIRIIAASMQGQVDRILVQAGTVVEAGTLLIELSNPELTQSAMDSEYQLRAAEADLTNIKVRLESERMAQQGVALAVRAEYQQARIQTETEEQLAREGLIPPLTIKLSRVKTEELAQRYEIEQKRADVSVQSAKAQLASQQARISQLQALLNLKQKQVKTMRVVAGTKGVLQDMLVNVGQQVAPGTNLARVVEPQHLKAQIKIPETQAKDVQLNQKAEVDTRNGVIHGHVMRIDPAAQQGTVTIDIALEGDLPPGARPDLTVDGVVEFERLENVIYMGRPALGQVQSTINIFKVEEGGKSAVRVSVKVGRSSVNSVEILEGLNPGDQVILSDASGWDAFDRILLK